MADHTDTHDDHGGHHVLDAKTLKSTFFILVGLTVLTVVLAFFERGHANIFGLEFELPELPLGALSVPVALGIAGTKVYWVATRFMGLKYEKTGTNALVFLGSSSFLIVFFAFTYLDFGFRDTFEELSAVPADIIEEQAQDAAAADEAFADELDAEALVQEADPVLFGTPDDDPDTPAPDDGAAPTE
ncbi:MAG: cytochrome C oxidase subunit IV family protein [Bacteroidota bacterium]